MTAQLMTIIVAYVQPFQLEPLADALRALPGFPGMTVSEARGFGGAGAHVPKPGEFGEVDPFRDTVRVEIVCASADAARITEAVARAAHTGHAGDGLVIATPVTGSIRIRDGYLRLRDEDAEQPEA